MVFLDMTQGSLVDRNQHSERTCCHPYSWSEMEAASSPQVYLYHTARHHISGNCGIVYIYSLPSEPQLHVLWYTLQKVHM